MHEVQFVAAQAMFEQAIRDNPAPTPPAVYLVRRLLLKSLYP
jgi:hypothetical protein